MYVYVHTYTYVYIYTYIYTYKYTYYTYTYIYIYIYDLRTHCCAIHYSSTDFPPRNKIKTKKAGFESQALKRAILEP